MKEPKRWVVLVHVLLATFALPLTQQEFCVPLDTIALKEGILILSNVLEAHLICIMVKKTAPTAP